MSNEEKSRALGMNFGTASSRLRKLILFDLIVEADRETCFRCGKWIEDVDDLSIEHMTPWRAADDPKVAFFDLENIAFSHLRCNSAEGNEDRKTPCLHGGDRMTCGECVRGHKRRYRNSPHGKARRRDYNREYMRQWRKNRV